MLDEYQLGESAEARSARARARGRFSPGLDCAFRPPSSEQLLVAECATA
jgi:hypothetical protein